MEKYYLTIDGNIVQTDHTFGVINPATGEVFSQAPDCSRHQLDLAVDFGKPCFPELEGR